MESSVTLELGRCVDNKVKVRPPKHSNAAWVFFGRRSFMEFAEPKSSMH